MSFNYREIAEILKVIDASDCEELALETEGVRLVVRRQGATRVDELSGLGVTSTPLAQGARARVASDGEGVALPAEHAEVGARAERRSDGSIEVRAPMVGTYYGSPSPADPPFVRMGDQVKPGQPLCLIEVMKLFTTIEATVAGTVTEVAAADGALVEYGQTLFVITPDNPA
jgi:acetyl-CoA carboxylase biotin carboxyl carrier protein